MAKKKTRKAARRALVSEKTIRTILFENGSGHMNPGSNYASALVEVARERAWLLVMLREKGLDNDHLVRRYVRACMETARMEGAHVARLDAWAGFMVEDWVDSGDALLDEDEK